MIKNSFPRRHFFFGSLMAGIVPSGGFGSVRSLKQLGFKSPNEKLNIAAVGAGGKGWTDINGCRSENIVALVDPDEKRATRALTEYAKARNTKISGGCSTRKPTTSTQ